MYLATLSKHPHLNSNQLMTTVYKIHYFIQLRSIICASLFKSTMSNLVHVMTRDYLDTNIIANDKNLVIMIPFMLCCVSWTSLIRLKIYINSTYEYQINEESLYKEKRKISAKGDCL